MDTEKIIEVLNLVSNEPNRIKTNSKLVVAGDIFIAVKGYAHDGHFFIKDAILRGANKIVSERNISSVEYLPREKFIFCENSKIFLAELLKRAYNDPSGRMKIYGVTGTNGKTTSVFLLKSILEKLGARIGLISTVYNNSSGETFVRSSMTTPDILDVYRLLGEMDLDNKKAAVIEVSSHALSQERLKGILFDAAILTNITPEHLDYHKTMENYLNDKIKIFDLLKLNGIGAVNIDDGLIKDAFAEIKKKHACKILTFGIDSDDCDFKAENISLSDTGVEFDIKSAGYKTINIKSSFIGLHNVYNILGCVTVLLNKGINGDFIKDAVYHALPVPGRLDAVSGNAPFKVFIDYAHTPNALENVLKSLRPITKNSLICVFGCGGDRDKLKRPLMGALAGKFSDMVILTSDNPRGEKPEDILREIEKGLEGSKNYMVIQDRYEAINKAVNMGKRGDVIIIAGKGHEDYQIIGEIRTHFDDKEIALKILKEKGYAVV
ncbi:UDP-N-acetylmuramyl tripeptide synthetase [Candidatus Omnitrophus magneticus]|uniref:UDP-N-acetylmuramoyl-L-alanyl-D-glutamate--2,6-diaminopimelate ligase n=1 Tax=Candidatus Omnitrophus magneticus TaxID=1609969 RepID=A0A0F0CRC2_9BACT|nr:UDP-N-acetylmuramyl tripeptide synthetase [Candidatus Omnitrophus magneticus]